MFKVSICSQCQKELPSLAEMKFCPFCGTPINGNTKDDSALESFTDNRDGEIYKLVKIGKQIWMAENLRYNPKTNDVVAYDNEENNVKHYGRLYSYTSIKRDNVIPKGFCLPSEEDIMQLLDFVRTNNNDEGTGTSLKAVKGWKYWSQKPSDYQINFSGIMDAIKNVSEKANLENAFNYSDISKHAQNALNDYDSKYNNLNGTDRFNFRALPAGHAYGNDYYDGLGTETVFWVDHNFRLSLSLNRIDCGFDRIPDVSGLKYSIRCIKDEFW